MNSSINKSIEKFEKIYDADVQNSVMDTSGRNSPYNNEKKADIF